MTEPAARLRRRRAAAGRNTGTAAVATAAATAAAATSGCGSCRRCTRPRPASSAAARATRALTTAWPAGHRGIRAAAAAAARRSTCRRRAAANICCGAAAWCRAVGVKQAPDEESAAYDGLRVWLHPVHCAVSLQRYQPADPPVQRCGGAPQRASGVPTLASRRRPVWRVRDGAPADTRPAARSACRRSRSAPPCCRPWAARAPGRPRSRTRLAPTRPAPSARTGRRSRPRPCRWPQSRRRGAAFVRRCARCCLRRWRAAGRATRERDLR